MKKKTPSKMALPQKKRKKPTPKPVEEASPPKQPFIKKLLFGEEKPDLSELDAGSTTILDILSSTAVDTKRLSPTQIHFPTDPQTKQKETKKKL